MTVDIARMDHNAIATLGGASDALERLGAWVEAASHANRLVAPLVDTPFVPDNYRPKVDPRATDEEKAAARAVAVATATAAVLQGITLGLDPLISLQQIYVVHGRPGMYAKMMVALVQARGHEVWTEDLSDSRAVVAGRRAGSQHIERITVTYEQARKAGWTSNQAYTKTPQDMLWSRAAARVCDRIASDVLKGIASVEAIQDELAPEGNGKRTVTPRTRVQAVVGPPAEPPLDEEPAAVESAAAVDYVEASPPGRLNGVPEPVDGITQAQMRKLHVLLKEQGLDREAGLAGIAATIDRDITSTKELTKAEATTVIDGLLAAKPAQDEPPLDDADGAS